MAGVGRGHALMTRLDEGGRVVVGRYGACRFSHAGNLAQAVADAAALVCAAASVG